MRRVLALGALAAALLVASGALAQDWDAWRSQLVAERDRLQALLAKSKQLVERVASIDLERRSALAALPEGFEAARLLQSVSDLAGRCGAELEGFEAGQEQGRAPVVGLAYQLRVRVARLGDAACVAAGLVRLERILTLESFHVQTGSERALAQLDLIAWAYRPAGRTDRPRSPDAPKPLPAGAPADVSRLHAEVAGLRRQAVHVQGLLERSDRLRAGLGAVAELRNRAERQQALGPFLRAVVTADPHPAWLEWDAGHIRLGGQVADGALADLIRETPLPEGFSLSLDGLEVRPKPAPTALEGLPHLFDEPGTKPGGSLVIHAVEADPLAVRAALRLYDQPLVYVGPGPARLTGRIVARDARRTLAALERVSPGLGKPTRVARAHQHGRGRKVSLEFYRADTHSVLRLLAEIGRINLVAPGELPRVSIQARNLPWDGVLKSIAAKAGRRMERIGMTVFMLPEGQRLPRVRAPRGRRVELRLERAWAAEAIGLLRQAVPGLRRTCLCGEGEPLSLQLHNASPREALTAILVAAGVDLSRNACHFPACSPPGGSATAGPPGRLAGVLMGRRSAALVRPPDGPPRLVLDGDELAGARVRIGSNGLRLRGPGSKAGSLTFEDPGWEPPPRQDPRALLGRLRLAATLTGQGLGTAVFEDPRGAALHIVRTGDSLDPDRRSRVRVLPGRVELDWRAGISPSDSPAPKRIYHLRPRAAATR